LHWYSFHGAARFIRPGLIKKENNSGNLMMNVGIIYNSFAHKEMLPEEKEMKNTGLSIGRYLSQMGHRVQYFDMDNPESIEDLCSSRLDVAFNACERVHDDARGEAYAAALLEFLGIPHTRTSSWLISLGISKERVKSILTYYQVPTPRYQVFRTGEEELNSGLQFPLFVKGLASENSIGIDEHSLVKNQEELNAKVGQIIHQLVQPALVEEYIDGREFSVAILPGNPNRVLPISEIVFNDLPSERRFLDYKAKWHTQSEQYQKTIPICPAQLADEDRERISRTALKCFNILGLDSYARIDFRFRDHMPYVLEVNQNPSISEQDSGYVRTCRRIGLNYIDMINALLQNAIARNCENCSTRTGLTETVYRRQDQKNWLYFEAARSRSRRAQV
jgi:D-alanine-D-alanine ligase